MYLEKKGEQGYTGPRGDKGTPGLSITGPKGNLGEPGLKGSKGNEGKVGLQGPSGTKGAKGNEGPKGGVGHKGSIGDKGEPGNVGLPGTSGEKGTRGAPGLTGDQGLPDLKGDMGDKGIQGPKGIDGLPGAKGDRGPIGLKGDTGPEGKKGNQGIAGLKGDKVNLSVQGPKGIDGPAGTPGLKGEAGPKGDMGTRGIQGFKEDHGAPGIDGAPGTSGPKGEQGLQEQEGDMGAPGSVGPKGDQGIQGPQGFNGTQGLPGDQGLQGQKGDLGPEGDMSAPGSIGLQGPIGPQGPKGENGIGVAVASKFLGEMNQTKIEIQDAQKAAEVARNASESSRDKVAKLHTEVMEWKNITKIAKEAAEKFANKAFQSEQNAEAVYSKTSPADQVCSVSRRKREAKKEKHLSNQLVISGASRPTSFISQVINFFYPSVKHDKYKVENKIQKLNQVAKIIDAADIAMRFEKALEETASNCGISKKSLNFNPVALQSTIASKSLFNDENRNELLKFLCSSAKEACPNCKQADKFLATFKDSMKRTLASNEQPRNFVNTEKIITDNEQPRSVMSDITSPSSFSAINQKVVDYLR